MNQLTPSNKFRIPTLGLIAIAGLLIALIAIFVFNVAVGSVLNYGFLAAMILSHFWMHQGHGAHHGKQEPSDSTNPTNRLAVIPVENNDQNRKHGCH